MISIVVASSLNGFIGKDGKLPWNIPEDLKHFKELTLNKHVVMGNNTYKSIGRPLPNRKNVVISRKFFESEQPCPRSEFDNVVMVYNLENALFHCRKEPEVMIIGGGMVYKEALEKDLVDRIYLTIVHKIIEGDVSFPIAPLAEKFSLVSKRDTLEATYTVYERNKRNG